MRCIYHKLLAIHELAVKIGRKRIFRRWHQFVDSIFRRKTPAELLMRYFVNAEIPLINAAMLYKGHNFPQTTVWHIKFNTERTVSN